MSEFLESALKAQAELIRDLKRKIIALEAKIKELGGEE